MTVPGGCRSQGCHGYLLRSLAAPFWVIRHLPHTHLLLMGLTHKYSNEITIRRNFKNGTILNLCKFVTFKLNIYIVKVTDS